MMVTADNLDETRAACPTDQGRDLVVGCETWLIDYDGGTGRMTCWPNGRGAVWWGGDSHWGHWTERDGEDVLVLDELRSDDNVVVVDTRGEEKITGAAAD